MTLILKAGFNFGEDGAFVIVSADTRMVYKPLNLDTGQIRDKTLGMRDDIYDKVIPLTNNVLYSFGGIDSVGRGFRDYFLERTEEHYYLDDFETIFQKAYDYFKENGDDVMKAFIDTEYVHVSLNGIRKNGNPGHISLDKNGEIITEETPFGNYGTGMFAPTGEIFDRQKELLDLNNSPFWNENDIFSTAVNHFRFVHAVVASQETETVSEKCLIHIIHRNAQGEITYNNGVYDLSDYVKQIQSE